MFSLTVLSDWLRGLLCYFDGSAPSISHLFSADSAPSIPHRKCGSATVRGAEVPTSACNVTFSNSFRKPHTAVKSLAVQRIFMRNARLETVLRFNA